MDITTFIAVVVMVIVAASTWRWFDLLFPRRREPDLSGMTSAERVAWFERGLRREIANQNDARIAREAAQRGRDGIALDEVQRRAPHDTTTHDPTTEDTGEHRGFLCSEPSVPLRGLCGETLPLPDAERVAKLDIPQPEKRRVMQAMLSAQMPHLRPMAR